MKKRTVTTRREIIEHLGPTTENIIAGLRERVEKIRSGEIKMRRVGKSKRKSTGGALTPEQNRWLSLGVNRLHLAWFMENVERHSQAEPQELMGAYHLAHGNNQDRFKIMHGILGEEETTKRQIENQEMGHPGSSQAIRNSIHARNIPLRHAMFAVRNGVRIPDNIELLSQRIASAQRMQSTDTNRLNRLVKQYFSENPDETHHD